MKNLWSRLYSFEEPEPLPPTRTELYLSSVNRRTMSFAENSKDKCVKGKSCGAACIFIKHECLEDLPGGMGPELKRVAELIQKSTKGIGEEELQKAISRMETGWSSNRTVELAKAFSDITRKYGEGPARDKAVGLVLELIMPAFAEARDRSKKLTKEEEQDRKDSLNKNADYIRRLSRLEDDIKNKKPPYTPQEINDKLKPFKEERKVHEISEEQTRLAWALLPEKERTTLKSQGSPPEYGVYEPGASTTSSPSSWTNKPTNEQRVNRALMGLRTYLEEDGRDMYTGKKARLTEMEWEHTFAVTTYGRGAETGAATGWTIQKNNQSKAEKTPEYLLKERKTKSSEPDVFNPLKRKAQSKTPLENQEIAGLISSVIGNPGLLPKDQAGILGSLFRHTYGVDPITYKAGTNERSSRRVEWVKEGFGQPLVLEAGRKLKQAIENGDQEKVQKIVDIIAGVPIRAQSLIMENVGEQKGSAGTRVFGQQAVSEAQEELEAL